MTAQKEIDFRKQVTDRAIKRASDHAEQADPGWNDKAFEFLKEFIKTNRSFLTEDVRYASQGIVTPPIHLRAWGGVIRRAACAGLIRRARYEKVKTISSHSALATVWHTV